MKISFLVAILCGFFCLMSFTRATYTHDRTSFSVKESDHSYELSADYNPDKTSKVQDYLDAHLKHRGDMSFKNTEIDATMTLNDKTLFYIKSSPGKLFIKFDKKRNSAKALARFRKLGEELRDLLTKK